LLVAPGPRLGLISRKIVCVAIVQPVPTGHELPPFDSDDIALEFLHKCDYNVALARLELTAALGYGHGWSCWLLTLSSPPPLCCVTEETVLDALTALRVQRSLGNRAIGRGPIDTVPMPFEVYQALKRSGIAAPVTSIDFYSHEVMALSSGVMRQRLHASRKVRCQWFFVVKPLLRPRSRHVGVIPGIVVTGNDDGEAMSEEGSDHGEIKPAAGSLIVDDDVSPGSDNDVRSDASDDEGAAVATASKGKRSNKVKESNPEFQKQAKWRKWLSEAQAAVNIGQVSPTNCPSHSPVCCT
jgi:hypothetical protein